MTIVLRKGVSLGAGGVTGSAPEQTYQNNAAFFQESNTGWVKIWAPWPTLQPTASTPLGQNFANLDSQIQAANAAGKGIILTVYKTPSWAGSTTDEPAPSSKSKEFRFPIDLSTTGPYGQFIQFLMLRYDGGAGSAGSVTCLEICNEPNSQMWPQQNSDGTIASGCLTSAMLDTAQAIHDGLGIVTPLILAPATADTRSSNISATPYDLFMQKMLDNLKSSNFVASQTTSWSHHNYNDVEQNRTGTKSANPGSFCIARDARNILISYGWKGYNPGTGETPPMVWLTEGGTRFARLRAIYGLTTDDQCENWQEILINDSHLHLSGADGGGDGVGMFLFTQYLFYSDLKDSFDSGLFYDFVPGALPRYRKVYWDYWVKYPNL